MVQIARLFFLIFITAIFHWTALVVAQSQPLNTPSPVYGKVTISGFSSACVPFNACQPPAIMTPNSKQEIRTKRFYFVFTPPQGGTCEGTCAGLGSSGNQTIITGFAVAGPADPEGPESSYLKAMAEVTRSDVHHGQAAVSAQAIRVDHFTTRLPTNRFSSTPFRDPTEPITIAFWLRANVSGAGGPLVKGQFDSSVWLSKPIRLRKGKWTSNWWGAGGVCGESPPSDPCHDGVQNPPIQITVESAEASLSGGTFWSIRLGNNNPDYRTLGPDNYGIFVEKQISVGPGYDFTIVSSLAANGTINSPAEGGPTHVIADLSNSVTMYVDAPGYIEDGGHDYSDPARRKTQIIVKSSASRSSPNQVPEPGYKIVGGGAQLSSNDLFLIGSYPPPDKPSGWSVDSLSSATIPKPHAVTGYSLQLQNLDSRFNVVSVQSTSSAESIHSRPRATAVVPDGFTLASGGCKVNKVNEPVEPEAPHPASGGRPADVRHAPAPTAPQSFLTGSYPVVGEDSKQMWVCAAQARNAYPAGIITAYAVGIKDLKSGLPVPMRIVKMASTEGFQPAATADLIPGFVISGCGASVEPASGPALWSGGAIDRQFLTGVFPNTSAASPKVASGCQATASDYGTSASGTVSAYAINLLLDRDVVGTVYPNQGPVGTQATIEGARISDDMKVQFVSQSGTSSAIVSVTRFLNSVHKASITVPSLPPGPYTLNVLQSDVPGPVKGPTFLIQ